MKLFYTEIKEIKKYSGFLSIADFPYCINTMFFSAINFLRLMSAYLILPRAVLMLTFVTSAISLKLMSESLSVVELKKYFYGETLLLEGFFMSFLSTLAETQD